MTSTPLDQRVAAVRAAFAARFGRDAEGVWRAPGRVNLIGEHTDYNDGFVLPFALEQSALVAASRRDDGTVRISSLDLLETHELAPAELVPGSGGWQAYLAGTVWALRDAGLPAGGLDLMLSSDVPVGAGLSSSAAIECAVMAAAVDLFALDVAALERARL